MYLNFSIQIICLLKCKIVSPLTFCSNDVAECLTNIAYTAIYENTPTQNSPKSKYGVRPYISTQFVLL